MRRLILALATALAGCGGDTGADDPFEPWWAPYDCGDAHPNGAPCCPQGLTLTEADCQQRGLVLADVGGGGTCTPEGRLIPTGPFYAVDHVQTTGATMSYGIAKGDGTAVDIRLCYPLTGFQRARKVGDCYTDCFAPDGRPADCRETAADPDRPHDLLDGPFCDE